MAVILLGLALMAALTAVLAVSIFGDDSLNLPPGAQTGLYVLAALLLLGFGYSVLREVRSSRG